MQKTSSVDALDEKCVGDGGVWNSITRHWQSCKPLHEMEKHDMSIFSDT